MNKTFILSILATIFGAIGAMSQTTIKPQYVTEGLKNSFGPGERLTFTVRYGFVTGGEGVFTVKDTVIDGRHANHIVCAGRTTGVADVFYKVRDSYESFLDVETQTVLLSKRNISEGKYRYRDVVSYDKENNEITKSVRKRDKPEIRETQEVPDCILDIIGAFYHARNNAFGNNLTVGDTIFYETFFANEIFPLRIRFDGRDVLKSALGKKTTCLRFSPVTEVGRSFKNKDAMHLWISDDDNHVPVKIEFEMTVGSFVCELTDAQGLLHAKK